MATNPKQRPKGQRGERFAEPFIPPHVYAGIRPGAHRRGISGGWPAPSYGGP